MSIRFTVLAALAVISVPGMALAADQDFTIKNKTGYQIDNIHVSPKSSSNWGKDIMGKGNVLVDEDSTEVTFSGNGSVCRYDLMVQYHDGEKATWNDLNLCEITTVTLRYDRKAGTTRATTE